MIPIIYVCSILIFIVNGEIASNKYDIIKEKRELPKNCGRNRFDEGIPRVINGKVAKLGQFPWIAKLGFYISPERIWFYCGGSLINRYFVISAAHCDEYSDVIRVGENYADYDIDCDETGTCAPPHQDLRIKRQKITDFCRITHKNDLLMIELLDPAEFNDFVQPICFPSSHWSMDDFIGEYFAIPGWGLTNASDFNSAPTKLMYITVIVNSHRKCRSLFKNMESSQFCMQYPKGGQNACRGDSGGPASATVVVNGVEREYLFGITSFGRYSCTKGSVHASVLYYRQHILKFIRQS